MTTDVGTEEFRAQREADALQVAVEHAGLHDQGGGEHDHGAEHDHGDGPVAVSPQPVPQSIQAELLTMTDGTDRVVVTYFSLNGSWTVFFDRDGALAQAKLLIELACKPPTQSAQSVAAVSDEPEALPIA